MEINVTRCASLRISGIDKYSSTISNFHWRSWLDKINSTWQHLSLDVCRRYLSLMYLKNWQSSVCRIWSASFLFHSQMNVSLIKRCWMIAILFTFFPRPHSSEDEKISKDVKWYNYCKKRSRMFSNITFRSVKTLYQNLFLPYILVVVMLVFSGGGWTKYIELSAHVVIQSAAQS